MESIFNLCRNGELNSVKDWLKDPQNDIIQGDEHGFSPLHWACKSGRADVVELLISRGALVNATNMGDDTPLHLASANGHLDIVKKLLGTRADTNATNEHGNTPLHYACFWNYPEVTLELLNHGSHVNLENRCGEIPLDKCKSNVAAILTKRAQILRIDISKTIPFKDQSWMGTKLRSRDATLSRNIGIDLNQITLNESFGSNYYDELLQGYWQNMPIIARILKYHVSPIGCSNTTNTTNLLSPTKTNFINPTSSLHRKNPNFITRLVRLFHEEYPKLRVFSHPNILPVLGGFYVCLDENTRSHFAQAYLQLQIPYSATTSSDSKYHLKNGKDPKMTEPYDFLQGTPLHLFVIVSQRMAVGSLFDVLHMRKPSVNGGQLRTEISSGREFNSSSSNEVFRNLNNHYVGVTDPKVLLNIALDICRGMAYLHSLPSPDGISHFYLSSKNVMLDENYRAQINVSDAKFSFQHKDILYNINWMSPESLKKKREAINVEASDMWSFAVILWEMQTKRIPFESFRSNASLGMKIVLQNLRLSLNEINCPHMRKLIEIAMNENPAKRPTFDMVTPILLKMIEK